MADTPDFAAEGLLDGLEDEDERAGRLELLEGLHDRGVSIEELRRAIDEERLVLLPVEMVFADGAELTAQQVAEQAGVELDWLMAQRQALGLPRPDPDAVMFSQEDVQAVKRTMEFRDAGFSATETLELSRVLGRAMAQVAEALREAIGGKFVKPGDSERDLALRYAAVTRALNPQLPQTLGYIANRHLLEQVRGAVITSSERSAGRTTAERDDVAVAFADLVGFTRLGSQVEVSELGEVAGRLAEMSAAVAEPPVRLVKTIGDAAMLVCPEPQPLLDAVLTLVAAADEEGDEFPELKAGMALGPALTRAGDWFGHTVNLASRVTGTARPGSVLTTVEVQERLEDGYRWSFAGERRLKGIKEPVKLFRARRAEQEGDEE
jgi:adenylate cyclase